MTRSEGLAAKQVTFGDELVWFATRTRLKTQDSFQGRLILLVHGFTAHGEYLKDLAAGLEREGFRCIIFNYNSYRGIENIARTLMEQLDQVDEAAGGGLSRSKLHILAHSMGGLVARALMGEARARSYVKGIITLGTPHVGTMTSSVLLKIFMEWANHVSGLLPAFMSSQSARELLGRDARSIEECLLSKLQVALADVGVPVVSISGGRSELEIAKNRFLNQLYNKQVQYLLGGRENDGLVPEKSANVCMCVRSSDPSDVKLAHFNNYSEYAFINHSGLVGNFSLALRIAEMLRLVTHE